MPDLRTLPGIGGGKRLVAQQQGAGRRPPEGSAHPGEFLVQLAALAKTTGGGVLSPRAALPGPALAGPSKPPPGRALGSGYWAEGQYLNSRKASYMASMLARGTSSLSSPQATMPPREVPSDSKSSWTDRLTSPGVAKGNRC